MAQTLKIIKHSFTYMRGLNTHRNKFNEMDTIENIRVHDRVTTERQATRSLSWNGCCIGRVSRRAPTECQSRCHMWRASSHLHSTAHTWYCMTSYSDVKILRHTHYKYVVCVYSVIQRHDVVSRTVDS